MISVYLGVLCELVSLFFPSTESTESWKAYRNFAVADHRNFQLMSCPSAGRCQTETSTLKTTEKQQEICYNLSCICYDKDFSQLLLYNILPDTVKN